MILQLQVLQLSIHDIWYAITSTHNVLQALIIPKKKQCACNGLFIICQHVNLNENKNCFGNICTPENILTFVNGTDAFYTSMHPHMSIVLLQDPMQNRKVLGNCYF